ncbi:MAG: hypothetical protein FJ100_03545 [Deltaproteobacteria bacterium]|nr:hypothetical protein [Deltaproteobacteria bacterium]
MKQLLVVVCGLLCALAAWADETVPAGDAPPLAVPTAGAAAAPAGKEVNCADRKDDDGDGMVDCADADCAKDEACKIGSGPENTNARCSDWFDNDGDGLIDCDDPDCEAGGVTICKGSWRGSEPTGPAASGGDDLPELGPGQSVEDLIGKGSDKDGERSDEVCSDGVDNDNDGRVDCADFGCRFDPDVTVCRGNPGMRFSVVAGIETNMVDKGSKKEFDQKSVQTQYGTQFTRLQLRTFGPMPLIQNSFYLLSIRAERDMRATFAMFQVPIGRHGHFININSGGGGLSTALITSTSKLLLLDPAYYMTSSFEQPNGAAMEVLGPITPDYKLHYRAFAAGGSGRSTGVIGGTYYVDDQRNYTYTVGGQLGINAIGVLNRFDSPFLYTPVATTLGGTIGAKFDQRAQERYPAFNANIVLRTGRLYGQAEVYGKKSLDFEALTYAWNVQLGFLAVPKKLMLAADYGNLVAGKMKNLPANLDPMLTKQVDQWQFRTAAHWYVYRNIGLVSALVRISETANAKDPTSPIQEREALLSAQYRF